MSPINKKKVLIISMRAGFGHLRAGSALLDYAKINLKNLNVEHVDILDVDPFLKPLTRFYEATAIKVPFVWGAIYKLSNFRITTYFIKYLGYFNFAFKYKIRNYIKTKNPDVILITNIICMPIFLSACKKIINDKKIAVLITDYHGHHYYKFSRVDYYFVPHGQVKDDLEKMGVKSEKIIVTGIPISPKFYVKHDIKELKLKYKIDNNYPTVLFISSFRISGASLISIVKRILKSQFKVNLIFIANGNKKFYDLVKNIQNNRFLSVNWTNEIEEYMKVSDVVISKAGGLTVSECIALKKPMIIVNPISGQEEHNAEFMEKNNFGKKVKKIDEIIEILPKIILENQNKNNQKQDTDLPKNPSQKIFNYI